MTPTDTESSAMKAIAEAQKRVNEINEMMQPHMNSMRQIFKQTEEITEAMKKAIEPTMKAMQDISYSFKFLKEQNDSFRIINEAQKNWVSTLFGLSASQSVEPKIRLIRLGKGQIIFESNVTNFRKSNSQHLSILKALLTESDETGFISYEALENRLVRDGHKPSPTQHKARSRILDAIRPIYRFLGIPKLYNNIEIIKIIEGKGLMIYNPLLTEVN